MSEHHYKTEDRHPAPVLETVNRTRGMFAPSFTSVATASISAIIAFNAVAGQLDTVDKIGLSAIVGVSTYLSSKIGKVALRMVGKTIGFTGGALFGGLLGAGAAAALSDDHERAENTLGAAAIGGIASGWSGMKVLGLAGSLCGFWGGAYYGHDYSKDWALQTFFDEARIEQKIERTEDHVQRGDDGVYQIDVRALRPKAA